MKVSLLVFCISSLMSCRTKLLDNCEGEYAFKRPYHTSHPGGRVMLGDTVELEVELPFKEHNHASCCDSIVDISRFNKVLLGISIGEYLIDQNSIFGFKAISSDNAFFISSPNVKLDFTPPKIGSYLRVRYYLAKNSNNFKAKIILTPMRKGVFFISLFDGVIEDAFCNAYVNSFWGDFTREEAVSNLERYLNLRIPDDLRVNWIMQEHQGYFILVE